MFQIAVLASIFSVTESSKFVSTSRNLQQKALHSVLLKSETTKSWDSVKVASASSTPTGYFMYNYVTDSTRCDQETELVYATGTGVCMIGYKGTEAVGSGFYDFGETGEGYFTLNSATWDSLDCTGTPEYAVLTIPTSCLTTDDGISSGRYTYTSNATPWTKFDHGLSFMFYDSKSHCSTGASDSFAWYKNGYCADQGDGTSFMFAACADEQLTLNFYNDTKCTEWLSTSSQPLMNCTPSGSDDDDSTQTDEDVQYHNYQSGVCV